MFDAAGDIVLAMTVMGEGESFENDDPVVARLVDAAQRLSARLGYKQ